MKAPSQAQLAARKRFAEMARSGAFKKKATKRKANPITETVIWGLAPGENRDYMEEIMYGGGQKLTKEQVDMVIAAATKAGYHSFRIGEIDMTKKPDFAGAVKTTKRKTNPLIISAQADKSLGYYGSRGHIRKLLEDFADSGRVVAVRKKRGSNAIGVSFSGGQEITLEKAKIYLENLVNEGILKPSPVKPFRMNNPIDNYIEKFHLGGKIYAQIIEKSDKTFDYYVYQMQSTGIPGEKPYEQFFDSKNYKTKSGAMRGLEKWAARHQYKVTPQLHTNPAKKTVSQKISQLVHEGYPQRQAVAVALSEQRAGKVKRNPIKKMKIEGTETPDRPEGIMVTKAGALKFAKSNMQSDLKKSGFVPSIFEGARGWVINYGKTVKRNPTKVKYRNLATDLKGDQRVGYSVHLASQPGHNAIAWFSKKADAVKVAQEAADRTGKDLAVSRVQNYFGAM